MSRFVILVPTLVFAVLAVAGPLPSEVDVLVAGGTTVAVETALAAKKAGLRVAIVSPRPYFGEDTAGRFELKPVEVTDEQVPVECERRKSEDGREAHASMTFGEATPVTRVEMVTFESGSRDTFRTRECHCVIREEGDSNTVVKTPLVLSMSYVPVGRYVWTAEVNRPVRSLDFTATRAPEAKNVKIEGVRIYRKCAPGTMLRPTPLEAKTALDDKLVRADIPFLTGAMGVSVLEDRTGRVCGAVFATREGLREIRAGLTVDASVHGVLLKAAGGTLEPLPPRIRLSRVVLSGERPSARDISVEELSQTWDAEIQVRDDAPQKHVRARLYRCTFEWDVDDTSRGWAAADMRARELTWGTSVLDAADELSIPPRRVLKGVPGLAYLPVDGHTPAGFSTLKPDGDVRMRKAELPVLANCDVCVVGAGTAGAPAAIAAARAGARTCAVEYQCGLGGLGTLGMIGYYWYGTVCGFTAEVEQGISKVGALVPGVGKREWWRRSAVGVGVDVRLGSMAYDVVLAGRRVVGVAVATPAGAGVVRANVVVDATGSADLAAAAGEETEFIGTGEVTVQGAGLSPRVPGFTYVNSDFGYVNDNDAEDVSLFAWRARRGANGEWDISQVTGTRERRRLKGPFSIQPEDVLNERTFPDTIATGTTDFDTHGPTIADVCFLSPATDKQVFRLNIPYRAFLPSKTDGLLVTGLAASAHRDAQPVLRMQADLQNEGYAAGRAAAMAVSAGVSPCAIDVKELQRHLIGVGSIPREVLGWKDPFPLSETDWQTAIADVGDGFKGVPLVLSDRIRARRDLQSAFRAEKNPLRRLCFAQVLGMLGDDAGAGILAENLMRADDEFIFPVPEEARRFGKRLTNRESQIVALGRTRSACAIPVLGRELCKISQESTETAVRAVSLACEAMRAPELSPLIARALKLPGIGGQARRDAGELSPMGGFARSIGRAERSACLKELNLARALLACGDCEELARKTLEAYAADPRGVYAKNARLILGSDRRMGQRK